MSEDVKKIRIEDYDYVLPGEKIARFPLPQRDGSKLLIAGQKEFKEALFRDLPRFLPEDAFLVFNETKVVQARLFFPKNESTVIEVFCLQPAGGMDIQQAMATRHSIRYECLLGGARKWKDGKLILKAGEQLELEIEKIQRLNGTFLVDFRWNTEHTFADILEKAGKTPLPPYLQRAALEEDRLRYQTLFARNDGSVAAPTASLHFSQNLLHELAARNIASAKLTLHVGAGTFKPVESPEIGAHDMHAEEIFISLSSLLELYQNLERKIIPVGTTAMRALESLYWLGVLTGAGKLSPQQVTYIDQWVPYEERDQLPEARESITNLIQYMKENQIDVLRARTAIIIAPGYRHKICSGLITNFHQPKSTLLLLVASLLGERWKKMYTYALENNFRFLSYGDGCLILK